MSNENTTEATKRKGGWPKGKPRAAKPESAPIAPEQRKGSGGRFSINQMKSRPDWSGDYVLADTHGVDRLKIPDDLIEALARDGIALEWHTRTIRGQEQTRAMAQSQKDHWYPVHQSDFNGAFDGMFAEKGTDAPVAVDDSYLVARPMAIHQKAKNKERFEASEPLRIKEAEIGHGIQNVTGSNHPTVRNSIKKTMERVEIPE